MFTQPKPNVAGLRPKLVFSLSTMQTCEKEIERRRGQDQGMDKMHDVLLMLMLHPYIHCYKTKPARVMAEQPRGKSKAEDGSKQDSHMLISVVSNRGSVLNVEKWTMHKPWQK